MPQSRRTLMMKHRASSLSALAHNSDVNCQDNSEANRLDKRQEDDDSQSRSSSCGGLLSKHSSIGGGCGDSTRSSEISNGFESLKWSELESLDEGGEVLACSRDEVEKKSGTTATSIVEKGKCSDVMKTIPKSEDSHKSKEELHDLHGSVEVELCDGIIDTDSANNNTIPGIMANTKTDKMIITCANNLKNCDTENVNDTDDAILDCLTCCLCANCRTCDCISTLAKDEKVVEDNDKDTLESEKSKNVTKEFADGDTTENGKCEKVVEESVECDEIITNEPKTENSNTDLEQDLLCDDKDSNSNKLYPKSCSKCSAILVKGERPILKKVEDTVLIMNKSSQITKKSIIKKTSDANINSNDTKEPPNVAPESNKKILPKFHALQIETIETDTFDDIDDALFFKPSSDFFGTNDDTKNEDKTNKSSSSSRKKRNWKYGTKRIVNSNNGNGNTNGGDSVRPGIDFKSRLTRFGQTLTSFRRVKLTTNQDLANEHPDEKTEGQKSSYCVLL